MHTNVIVVCPKDCGKEDSALIYGSVLYKDDSSICRAAIHSG